MQPLRADLADGRLKVGQRLAPERELCARFGVSRNTLRRALLDLEEQGLLAAAGRDGWYVAASPLVELARGPHSLTAWAREAGLVLTSRVMHQRLRPAASPLEAAALGVRRVPACSSWKRLRIVDGLALSLDRSCLPGALAAALEGIDFAAASLYDALAERAGWCRADRDCALQATTADARSARLLATPGAPLLLVHETVVDQRGRPLEFALLANRGDRWRYRATHLAPELGGAGG